MLFRKKVNSLIIIAIVLSFIFIGSIFAISNNDIAYATDSTTFTTNQVTNNYVSKEVAATFGYSIIDEEQHFVSVRITNKTAATKAVIPSTVEIDGETYTVTEIAASGFASSTLLKRVTLANTIKKIGNSAFTNCSKLEHVFLSNVETIGNYAFMRCSNLSKVVIPASVQTIGSNVFRTNATAIEARLAEAPATWSSTWNSNNSGTVTYNSQYFESPIFEPLYESTSTQGTIMSLSEEDTVVGYAFADGQPYAETFYNNNENIEIIPAVNPEDNLPILEIDR